MLAVALTHLALVFAVSASPVQLAGRDLNTTKVPRYPPAPSCDGLGANVFSTAHDFTLTAFNTTNDLVGAPLVFGQNGASAGMEFKVWSTLASYPYRDFVSMTMHEGGISPTDGDIKGADGVVNAGEAVSFTFSNLYKLDPAPIYCGIESVIGGNPILAVNNDPDNFALCDEYGQVNVFYKPDLEDPSCYPVILQMIGLLDGDSE